MAEYVDTLGEIYLERARYLLNTDDMLEEMYRKIKNEIADNIKMGFRQNTGTVCFGALIDTDEAHGYEISTHERFPVCMNNFRKFVEIAADKN